ncbi:MAG: phosphatidate cytidylyltransferase [Aestuariibaculum sp.]
MKLNPNKKEGKFADVPVRVKSWAYIIVVFVGAVSNIWLMAGFTAWLTFQSLREFKNMFELSYKFATLSVVLSGAQIALPYFCPDYGHYIVWVLIITLLSQIVLWFIEKKQLESHPQILLCIPIAFFAFGHLTYIRNFSVSTFGDDFFGIKCIVFLVVVTEFNDVFQYLSGKFFGKRQISPKISPNKTIEGLLGGLFFTLLLSNILAFLLPVSSFLTVSAIGLVIGLLGFLGDMLVSYLKREAKVKDTGSLIPGHGGLLDRMDSLIFNAPLFYGIILYGFG